MNHSPRKPFAAILPVLIIGLTACAAGPGGPNSVASSTASASAGASSGEPTGTPAPGFTGHPAAGLALLQWPDPNSPASHVFVVGEDGSLRQVTGMSRESAGASTPVWSPDRTRVAFGPPKAGGGMTFEVGVVNADGSDERVVGIGSNPEWSPDGSRILFGEVDDVTSEPRSMFVVDVESGEVTDIGQGSNPQWMPTGERISFVRPFEDPGNAQPIDMTSFIDTVSAQGGEPEELVQAEGIAWAPDGSSCLLLREGTIALADPDGSNPRELGEGWEPVWSPQGDAFVFAYDIDTNGIPVLAVADLEGHARWFGISGARPTWSPDGTRIAVEVAVPDAAVVVLDASSGEELWRTEGAQPAWAS
jgi:Tol biopolymer transport system component